MLSFKGIGPGRRERSGTNRKERWQSKSQMADADPSALASPRFAFSDQGVPAISRPGFNLGGPIQAPCLRPARTPLSPVALMPCGSVGPALRPRQLLQVTQGPTQVCLGQQRPSLGLPEKASDRSSASMGPIALPL